MKQKDTTESSFIRRSRWTGLMLVLVAAVTLEATSLIQFFFSQNAIRQEATLRAESELESTRLEILNVIDQAESAVRNNIWIARWCLDYQDSLSLVTSRLPPSRWCPDATAEIRSAPPIPTRNPAGTPC